ncbi:ATP-binding cassette sub- A member 1 [Haplosporangium sp. Z 767]|nr:ATP-binding cassette sub- A member 1 [Haplosporangium sp. Z 11]KAF9188740.1 ATP-binding cassette sub- A member 1 [Haplosporangium sp. Z 767]
MTSPSSPSSTVVFASARPSSATGKWFRQLGVVCRLNCILIVRYWKATLLQAILIPLLAIGIVYGIEKASTAGGGKEQAGSNDVATWKMDGIHQCKPEPLSNACMTLVYAPQTPETIQIMNYFQTKNQARTNTALLIENNVWADMSNVPKNNMGIVPMPSDQFIYDYALAHPDTIQLGVVFTKEAPTAGPVHWNYQVYYNITHATNTSTLAGFKYKKEAGYNRETNFDDPYGVNLPNIIRAMDESLLTFLDPQHQQADLDFSVKSFPTADTKNPFSSGDDVVNMLSNLMSLPACITMVMTMLRVTREKESKCKESMQMMGLSTTTYWTAQWLTSWIMSLIQASVIVALGHAFGMAIFTNSNWFVMWCTFALLTYGMTLFGFFLTTFCQKSGSALAFGFAVVVAVLIVLPTQSGPTLNASMWIDTLSPYGEQPDGTIIYPAKVYNWVSAFFFSPLHFAQMWSQISTFALGSTDYRTGEYTPGVGFNFSTLTNFDHGDPALQNILPQPVSALTYYGVNILLYALLTLYFDQVIPNEHGHRRGLLFFFGSIGNAFRFIRHGGSAGVARHKSAEAQKLIPYEGVPPENEDSDVIAERERAVNCQSQVAIRISNLTKIYTKNGPGFFKNIFLAMCCCCCRQRRRANKIVNKAVDRLNLITEPNELFALLGQNGAGKSTTMQMLYGVTDPTSGNAFLFNRSIRTDMQAIRATMGVCPQHDVLFNDLTCWEHMQLYAGIKDLPAEALFASLNEKEQVKENTRERPTWIRSRLEAVQLWNDRNTMAGRLSGGMKRRLSTIISTIGDPDVLILDEPTTGMDPVHRRHVWTFLAQFKRGRSILLTTHSMEEADALGDKVAIMVAGHLKAIGNTTRLKNKFGNGYRIEIALGNYISTTQDPSSISTQRHQQQQQHDKVPSQMQLEQELTDATRAIIPESILLDQSGGVMVFGVPMQGIERMADLTAMLEKSQAQGRIKHWGIAQTSLEEVFLSLVRSAEDSH